MAASFTPHPASYRDPSGFVFTHNNQVYRQINDSFKKHWDALIASGLYNDLTAKNLLISHTPITENLTGGNDWYQTIKPEQLPFISYPYEWTFTMLKDAALLTLQIAKESLEKDFMLKDASPYNLQPHNGKMIFIDSLSFETYTEGEPWVAYRQFCECFLSPLAMMHYCKLPLNHLFLTFPDGIPLLYAKKLLPYRSRFHLQLYLHLHLHAAQKPGSQSSNEQVHLSKPKLMNVLESLRQTVEGFRFNGFENVWGGYYEEAAARNGYLKEKKGIVQKWLSELSFNSAIDIGGNSGEFAQLAWAPGRRIICADGEHFAIDALYKSLRGGQQPGLFPVVMDFANPSSANGLNNTERDSFFNRASSDLAMALAVVHHLAIGRNIPFEAIAKMFAGLGKTLIIEFVTKDDPKTKLLLRHKKDVYHHYNKENFLNAFKRLFRIISEEKLTTCSRSLYLMERI